MKKLIVALCVGFSCASSACAGQTGNAGTAPATTPTSQAAPPAAVTDKNATLVFFDASQAADNITTPKELAPLAGSKSTTPFDDPVSDKLADADSKNKIVGYCQTGGTKSLVLAGLLADAADWAIGQLVNWVVGEADSAIDAQAAKYQASHLAAGRPVDIYDLLSGGKGIKLGTDVDDRACFRFTVRGPSKAGDANSNPTILIDYIGEVEYSKSDPRALTLRPVRIFVTKAALPRADKQVAVSVSLTADAWWIGKQQGHNQTALIKSSVGGVLIKDQDFKDLEAGKNFYRAFQTAPDIATRVPLPPWDASSTGGVAQHGELDPSVSATLVGDVPWLLKTAEGLLDKNKDAISQDIVAAANKYANGVINPPAQTAPAAP